MMWDVGGQDSLRASWSSYYVGAAALILVVDCTDRERLAMVKSELFQILTHEDLKGAKVGAFFLASALPFQFFFFFFS